jgi:hypothetical protein
MPMPIKPEHRLMLWTVPLHPAPAKLTAGLKTPMRQRLLPMSAAPLWAFESLPTVT